MSEPGFLMELQQIVRERLQSKPESSYTARLAASGILKVAQKVGEEGVELALAAAAQDDSHVVEEAADLLFHLLVLLELRDISLTDVIAVLEARHRQ